MNSQSVGLLADIRVLDLSMHLAGPYGTLLLADLGADVIKVEPPHGDPMRAVQVDTDGVSQHFLAVNRNKRSLVLDLRTAKGRNTLIKLSRSVDVVYHNYRPGFMERHGLAFSDLVKVNSRLVYCSLSGFGLTGPKRQLPAFDLAIQALSGGMSLTGFPGRPARSGIPIADNQGGLFAAIAVLAGLWYRNTTGQAVLLDTSMFDVQLSMISQYAAIYLNTGVIPGAQGVGNSFIAPYGAFACRDGRYILINAAGETAWADLCRVLGVPQLPGDARFADNGMRIQNRASLDNILRPIFLTRDASSWLDLLGGTAVVVTPVNDIESAMNSPGVAEREMITTIDYRGRKYRFSGNPVHLSHIPVGSSTSPPELGEHSREVLQEFGFSEEDINRLASDRVIEPAVGASERQAAIPLLARRKRHDDGRQI